MFYGAGPLIFKRAEELRKNMTSAESIIWKHLHINEWNLKFRRQHPISNFIVDFYCHALKLVIEIDGDIHDLEETKKNDILREKALSSLGLKILRFNNEMVYKSSKEVLQKIDETIDVLQSSPLGDGGKQTLYVIKIGGNIIDDEIKLKEFLKNFADIQTPLQGMGAKKILVHGGGKLATKLAEKLGVEQKLVDGRRITDGETLKIVTMVYAGYINKNIVAQLQSYDCNAIGLCGADGDAILAHKRESSPQPLKGSNEIDYGFAGDIDKINAVLLNSLLKQNFSIVISPITHNKEGQLLNTNADTIAQEIAKAMSKYYDVTLIYSFEKAGVLTDINDENSVIHRLSWDYYQELKSPLKGMGASKIFAGMIPKLDNAFVAINCGVKKVIIGKAEQLKELINGEAGTTILNE